MEQSPKEIICRILTTGLNELDSVVNILEPGMLTIISGKICCGKSAFVTSLLIHLLVEEKASCGLFSLELSSTEIMERMVCGLARIDACSEKITRRQKVRFDKAVKTLRGANLHIDERPALTISEIKTEACRMVREKGVRFIAIDNLQYIKTDDRSICDTEEDAYKVLLSLKRLSVELGVSILAVSRLTLDGESSEAFPTLDDLKSSDAIQQCADSIVFINHFEDRSTKERRSLLAVAKSRNGEYCVPIEWIPRLTLFRSLKQIANK